MHLARNLILLVLVAALQAAAWGQDADFKLQTAPDGSFVVRGPGHFTLTRTKDMQRFASTSRKPYAFAVSWRPLTAAERARPAAGVALASANAYCATDRTAKFAPTTLQGLPGEKALTLQGSVPGGGELYRTDVVAHGRLYVLTVTHEPGALADLNVVQSFFNSFRLAAH